MATTVQLNESTKEELLVIKAQLEILTGKKQSLDDAVHWLIQKAKSPPVEDRIKYSHQYFGSIKDLQINLKELTKLRQQRTSRVADF